MKNQPGPDAARLVNERLARDPSDPDALTARVWMALGENRTAEALAVVSRATAAPVKTVTLLRANIACHQRHWSSARDLFLSLTQQDSQLPEAWYGLGGMHLRLGAVAEAVAAHRRAVALRPHHPSFHLELGRALALANAPREAVHHLVVALRLAPEDERPYGVLSGLLFDHSHPRLARRVLGLGLRQVPGSAFLKKLGATLFPDPAPARRDPREDALLRQASELLTRSRNRDALKLLREAGAQGLRTVTLKLLEAEACEALLPADLVGAERALTEAIALAPNDWVPHSQLGLFLLRQGGLRGGPRAIAALEQARRLGPRHPEPILQLAWAYAKGGRHAEAAQLATQLVQALPSGHPLLAPAQALVPAKAH